MKSHRKSNGSPWRHNIVSPPTIWKLETTFLLFFCHMMYICYNIRFMISRGRTCPMLAKRCKHVHMHSKRTIGSLALAKRSCSNTQSLSRSSETVSKSIALRALLLPDPPPKCMIRWFRSSATRLVWSSAEFKSARVQMVSKSLATRSKT